MLFDALSRLGESQAWYLTISDGALLAFVAAAVAGAFSKRLHAWFAHERFPELAAIVRRDYRFAGTVRFTRVYVRRDESDSRSNRG